MDAPQVCARSQSLFDDVLELLAGSPCTSLKITRSSVLRPLAILVLALQKHPQPADVVGVDGSGLSSRRSRNARRVQRLGRAAPPVLENGYVLVQVVAQFLLIWLSQ